MDAMYNKLQALGKNNTGDPVPRTSDMNVIGNKWVYKTKLKTGLLKDLRLV